MTEDEALQKAFRFLNEYQIVHVFNYTSQPKLIHIKGIKPQALPDTFLVRVEQDGSTRVVSKGKNVS